MPIVRHLRLPEKNPPVQPVFNLYVTAAAEIALPPKKPSQSVKREKRKAA